MKDLSLDELAEIAGLSKYYLIHSFKKKFSITPYSYMTNLRINTSETLLPRSPRAVPEKYRELLARIFLMRILSSIRDCSPGRYLFCPQPLKVSVK
jgi:AraC-like DNA-binding protein